MFAVRPCGIVLGVVLGVAACTSSSEAPPPPGQGWMEPIADSAALSELSIPGTHESLALYEPLVGTAKCQVLSLAAQLDAGVRYVDVRCRHLENAFQIFHGPVFEQQTFDDVVATVLGFLDEHPSETLIMSIKEESTPDGSTRSFEDTFASYVARAPDRWYLGTSLPRLGEARGKIVLLRRFSATSSALGIDASSWADDTTFSIGAGPTLRVQDAYQVTDDTAKWTAIADLLDEARSPSATLYLDYTSGYQMHGALPNIPSVADVINQQLDTRLADPATASAHLGVVVNDFMTEARALRILRRN